jgi:hypothetical protein
MSDLLYHYTTEAGLTGIIGSDNLRAAHIEFLNDYTELRQAFTATYTRVLLDSFKSKMTPNLPCDAQSVMNSLLSKRGKEILGLIEGSKDMIETFVFSFTGPTTLESGDPGDRLSQWRGYASTTQGYSLGFDPVLLKERLEFDRKYAKATLQQCIYEEPEKIALFEKMGSAAASHFNELWIRQPPVPDWFTTNKPDATTDYRKANSYFLLALSGATADFFTSAARIKDKGFYEEREWRIVLQAKKDALAPKNTPNGRREFVNFCESQLGWRPFIELSLGLTEAKKSPLRRIVVGPGSYKEEKKKFVELFLLNAGIEGIEITSSVIPYRTR